MAKKISFFFTSFELILAFLKDIIEGNFLLEDSSLIILTFKLFDKFKFLDFIDFKIIFLSEKKILCFPKSCIVS